MTNSIRVLLAFLALLSWAEAAEGLPPPAQASAPAAWRVGDLPAALETARASKRPLLLEFSTTTCAWCRRLASEVLVQKELQRELENWVCVRLDLTLDESGIVTSQEAADLGNRFGIGRFPTLVALRSDGAAEDVVSGFLDAPSLLAELRRIRSTQGTLSDWERRVARDPADLELRYQLGQKRYALGDFSGFQADMEAIQQADPEGRSVPMRRFALNQMREEMFGCMRGALPVDPAPLVAFLEEEQHASLSYQGWKLLGTVHRHLGSIPEMIAAWREAWRSVPEVEREICGNALAWDFWEERERLTSEQRAFALEVALTATKLLGDARGDDALRASYLDTLACCYFMNGQKARAVETSRECLRLAPGTAEYLERLEFFQSSG